MIPVGLYLELYDLVVFNKQLHFAGKKVITIVNQLYNVVET